MKVRFVLTSLVDGGMALAVQRLALALSEAGHDCDIVVPSARAEGDSTSAVAVTPCRHLPASGRPIPNPQLLTLALADGAPEMIVVAEGRGDLLRAASDAGPTLLHAQLNWAVCADATRYWSRLHRECSVHAGWKCVALRPLLGCSATRRSLTPRFVSAQQRVIELLSSGAVGTLAISGHQAELLYAHGVPRDLVSVVPNLGVRMTAEQLERAADITPEDERSAFVFLGRLSKEKGAGLLPDLALHLRSDASALRVFGDGYLTSQLRAPLGDALRGHVSQDRIAGVLQWARAVIFPSLWPEPGGIVGIDAQIFGVPLAAFARGAAMDWPRAELFNPGDLEAVARWCRSQPDRHEPRSAPEIAHRQDRHWKVVAERASTAVTEYRSVGRFAVSSDTAVRIDLESALAPSAPHREQDR